MDRKTTIWIVVATVVSIIFSFWYGLNNHLLPEQASIQAPLVDDLFNVMVVIGTGLFILMQALIVYSMIRFRQPKGDESDGIDLEGNISLEIVWTAVPAVIVIGLGIYSVQVYEDMGGLHLASPPGHMHGGMEHEMAAMPSMGDMKNMGMGAAIAAPMLSDAAPMLSDVAAPDEPKRLYGIGNRTAGAEDPIDLIVNVTGMQFAWLFEYPEQGITTGELYIPEGKRIRLKMKAVDVIHSFWVPQFRLKQDVIPGEETRLQFIATKLGTYPVFCAELCGSYHGGMRTTAVVQSESEFAEWVKSSQVAQLPGEAKETIALVDRTPSEFLEPYAKEIGLNPEDLPQPTLSRALSQAF
jgi:cytochrome c oxidase subunit II